MLLCRGSGVNFILPRTLTCQHSQGSTALGCRGIHLTSGPAAGALIWLSRQGFAALAALCHSSYASLIPPTPNLVPLHRSAVPAATEKQFWSEGPAGTRGELLGKVWLQSCPFCTGEAACGNHETTTRSARQPCSRDMWAWVNTKMEKRKWKLCTHRPWAK